MGRWLNMHRNAGAPRLIELTGERCLPWAPEPRTIYEHMHRYLWAAGIVRGRRVLDVGSGEGFGAAILAEAASEVVGIDLDQRTVEHSQANYARPGISFQLGDARNLEMFESGSFGAVVAFEVIEHFAEQEQALAEIARVLMADGVLVISTPDRLVYSEEPGFENPFHARELSLDEFRALIASQFRHQRIWGQRLIAGSHITDLDPPADAEGLGAGEHNDFFIERRGDDWHQTPMSAPTYLIAVASQSPLAALGTPSTLADPKLELATSMEEEVVVLRQNVSDRDALIGRLQGEAVSLRGELAEVRGELAQTRRSLARAEESLQAIEQSVSFQLVRRLSARLYGVIGRDSPPARALQATLRWLGRVFGIRGDR